ncbi:MAG TPA: chemotaxis protein CheB [Candidatus Nitrosocosmicus sp.]
MTEYIKDAPVHPKFIITIGASAGGISYIVEFLANLNGNPDVAIFIVMHMAEINHLEYVLERLQNNTALVCKIADNEDKIQSGHVYLAKPGYHLIIDRNQISLGNGATENRWRPSIDVLMRTAAVDYNSRTIGIILSGLLTDGTAGMIAIKKCGGVCIVQKPEDAEYPDMPLSVLENMDVDYVLSIPEMVTVIQEKLKNGIPSVKEPPIELKAEAEIAKRVSIGIENVKELGIRSNYTCPDCGGGLWEIKGDNIVRYRCFTGHAFTENELLLRQTKELENTLWIALRMLEERSNLLQKMYKEESSKGLIKSAQNKKERYEQLVEHIQRLKKILFETNKN